MTGQELAQAAREALGVGEKAYTEFARKLDLSGDHRNARVKRWLTGQNDPDYEGTVKMLEAAGLLREEAAAMELSSGDPLQSLAAAVASMVRTNRELHERVEAVEGELHALAAKRRPGRSRSRRPA